MDLAEIVPDTIGNSPLKSLIWEYAEQVRTLEDRCESETDPGSSSSFAELQKRMEDFERASSSASGRSTTETERSPSYQAPLPAGTGPTSSESKESNPKQAFGDAKSPLSCVPFPVLFEVGLGMLEGHLKGYRSHNYRVAGVRTSTYFNAVMRHLAAWWEGQDIDPDSNLPHIVKAICCLVVFRDAQMLGKVTDDRPPRHMDGWLEDMMAHVA